MSDYIERMRAEKRELFLKANALDKFVKSEFYKTLEPRDQELMKLQHTTMCDYYEILEERIMRAKP